MAETHLLSSSVLRPAYMTLACGYMQSWQQYTSLQNSEYDGFVHIAEGYGDQGWFLPRPNL